MVAVVPALLSVGSAARLARRFGAPLVVWVQDLMAHASAQSGMDGGRSVAGVVGSLEARLLSRANRVLVLNGLFEEHVRGIGVSDDRIVVQPNWTHVAAAQQDRDEVRTRYGWGTDHTVVLHTGNMGLKQALENVVAAGTLADERGLSDVRFVLMGDGSQRQALEAAAAGVRSVAIMPPVPGEEYADVLAAADILLVNERASSVDMSLPSKLTSYFCAERPIIAASPAEGGTALELVRSGGGIVVRPEDPASLLDSVIELAKDTETAQELGRAGRVYAESRLTAHTALARLEEVLVIVSRRPGDEAP